MLKNEDWSEHKITNDKRLVNNIWIFLEEIGKTSKVFSLKSKASGSKFQLRNYRVLFRICPSLHKELICFRLSVQSHRNLDSNSNTRTIDYCTLQDSRIDRLSFRSELSSVRNMQFNGISCRCSVSVHPINSPTCWQLFICNERLDCKFYPAIKSHNSGTVSCYFQWWNFCNILFACVKKHFNFPS